MKRVFKSTLSCMLAFAMVLGGFCNTGSSVSDAKTKKVAPVSLKKKSAIIVIKQNADKITKGNASIKIKKKKGVKIKTTTYKVADKSIVKVSHP